MSAATYDTTIEQGATWTRTITWQTGSTPSPVNLTGYTARMSLKGPSLPVFSLTTENGRITLGGSAGTVTLLISAADTAGMSPVDYKYDLELVTGSVVFRLLEGVLSVSENITT